MMRFRVVAIEDEPEIADLLRVVLHNPRLDVFTVGTAEEGLDLIREVLPDLVMLDVMLPGELDGWDVFDAIRADPVLRDTPVLMLSVLKERSDRSESFRRDPQHNQYLTKPFNTLSLRQHVEQMLGVSGLWKPPSGPLRNVVGMLNEATEALDLERRRDDHREE